VRRKGTIPGTIIVSIVFLVLVVIILGTYLFFSGGAALLDENEFPDIKGLKENSGGAASLLLKEVEISGEKTSVVKSFVEAEKRKLGDLEWWRSFSDPLSLEVNEENNCLFWKGTRARNYYAIWTEQGIRSCLHSTDCDFASEAAEEGLGDLGVVISFDFVNSNGKQEEVSHVLYYGPCLGGK